MPTNFTPRIGEAMAVGTLKLCSDWRAFGVNFLFLLGTHAAKWMQHPLKYETHASNLRPMARQSERGLTVLVY